ncbi:peptidase inhibitor 16 isoform X2 [Onychomys torridus]|uniref:peptidase inhibitor 16 isoform X2 n=1 Tax=Onychomys torridus TaxID=38674 RepID=UPI00167F5C15|nr:peptidase inhibitor 16 isoform X2 [Onychomys torridus]
MQSSCSLWATLFPLLLLTATGPTSALTEDEKQAMVELHNFYRAQVSPPASDMLQMRWDNDLAAFAKAYAQKCVWGHNKERGRRGENLFAITDQGMDVPLAVGNWYEEREHYNFSTATCEPGQMCGHYTQVIWSKTERIGCGSHFCETLQGVEEANIHLLVCNYEPPGNVKGRKPYQEGIPCSQCPADYSCENSLCEVSDSLATESSPALETKAPSSLATEGPSSMATEAESFLAEVPSVSTTHSQPSLDEGPVNFPTSTHVPDPKSTDKEASKSSATSVSPEKSLYPTMSLTQTGETLLQAQVEAEAEAELPEAEAELPEVVVELPEAEAELPVSSEVLSPAQEHSGPQASLDHSGDPASNFPSASASANATGGRTLALQSPWTGAEDLEKAGLDLKHSSGHVWGPFLGLLLPPLLLAGIF